MTQRDGNIQTKYEEIANSLTHGIGLIIAIIAFVVFSNWEGNESEILSLAVYGSTLFLLYTASTLYHSVQTPKLKKVFQILDHSAIYLFIAGCYTPVMFKIGNHDAMVVLTIVWSMALLGVYMKAFHLEKTKTFSLVLYLLMGWLAVVMIKSIMIVLPMSALLWLFAGGVAYTLGVFFYVKDGVLFFHTVWHLFVLAGSWCHFHMIIFYTVQSWPIFYITSLLEKNGRKRIANICQQTFTKKVLSTVRTTNKSLALPISFFTDNAIQYFCRQIARRLQVILSMKISKVEK